MNDKKALAANLNTLQESQYFALLDGDSGMISMVNTRLKYFRQVRKAVVKDFLTQTMRQEKGKNKQKKNPIHQQMFVVIFESIALGQSVADGLFDLLPFTHKR